MFPCTVKLEFNGFMTSLYHSDRKYAEGLYELHSAAKAHKEEKTGFMSSARVPDDSRTRLIISSNFGDRVNDMIAIDVPYEEVERLLLAAREIKGIAKFSFKDGEDHGIIGTLAKNHPIYSPGG